MGDLLLDQSDANQIKRKKDWRSIIKKYLVKMGPNKETWTIHAIHTRQRSIRVAWFVTTAAAVLASL